MTYEFHIDRSDGAEWLEIGVGAQILADLGLRHIRILAGREVDFVGLEGFGLTLDSTELLSGSRSDDA